MEGAMAGEILGELGTMITSVCTDTRTIQPGALFFALHGESSDGHLFVSDAFAKGAVAAIVDHEVEGAAGPQIVVPDTLVALGDFAAYYRDRFDIPIVAVTGSVGKTTTREMITVALGARYNVLS